MMEASTTTDGTEECGVLVAAAKTARVLDLLQSMPMDLPEPGINTIVVPELRWSVDEHTARRIVTFLGLNDWSVFTYDEPRTIATRYLDATYDHRDLVVVIVVDGVNLPDLCAETAEAAA